MPERGRPLVVVVSGMSGAGKSSLVTALAAALRTSGVPAVELHFDDFTDVPDLPGGDLPGWLARGAQPAEWRTPAMDEALAGLLTGEPALAAGPEVVLVEEPFGRARPPFDVEADLSVHLRLPSQVALARRLLRELAPADDGLDPAGVSALRHHLTRFVTEGNALYEAVEVVSLAGADVVLDGLAAQESVTRQALDAVLARLGQRSRRGPEVTRSAG